MNNFDLIIRNGTVVDGLGAAPSIADVAIAGKKIVKVGDVPGTGTEEIDAKGHYVTPGFVDVHTHYDGQITWENRLAPSSGHGITTVIMGNCGVGFAPVRSGEQDLLIKLMEGVEDIPEVVMANGIPWNWETFPEYLDALSQRVSDIDFAAQLPHSPLRVYVMGQRGVDLEPPTAADLAEMRRLTAEAIRAGAVGVSTSRSLGHRFPDGRLAPSVSTDEQELLALAGGLADAGAGVFQLQSNRALPATEEFALMRRIAQAAGRPLSFTLIPDQEGDWRNSVEGLKQAAHAGLEMRGQFLPRPLGILFGLDLSLHPFALKPSFRTIAHLPLAEKVAAMRCPEMRAALLSETACDPVPNLVAVTQKIHPLFVLGDPPAYLPSIDDSLRAQAAHAGIDELEFIYDALLKDEGHSILYSPTGGYVDSDFEVSAALFDEERTILGLGDGGAHYGIICDAAFPTFFLIEYVRDARPAKQLPIERAFEMLARETAEAVGFSDRGIIAPGYKADLNIIDLAALRLHAPRMSATLPAGGRRLTQHADGFLATIVSGQVTYRDGQPTGALPGRLVRSGQFLS